MSTLRVKHKLCFTLRKKWQLFKALKNRLRTLRDFLTTCGHNASVIFEKRTGDKRR